MMPYLEFVVRLGLCFVLFLCTSYANSTQLWGNSFSITNALQESGYDETLLIYDFVEDYMAEQLSYGGNVYRIAPYIMSEPAILNHSSSLNTGEGTTVHYINGILTDREALYQTLRVIIASYRNLDSEIRVGTATYNRTASEGANDLAKFVCPMAVNRHPAIAREGIESTCRNYIRDNSDTDLADAVWQKLPNVYANIKGEDYVDINLVSDFAETIKATVSAGQKVVLIAHSQGNFYVRDALQLLENDPIGQRFLSSIGVIMVASPVHPGALPDTVQFEYVGNCFDPVAYLSWGSAFESLVGECLRPYERYGHGSLANHFIIEDYLYDVGGVKIRDAILRMHKELKPPHTTFQINDRVVSNDHLNVRSQTIVTTSFVVEGGTKMYTVEPGSIGTITDVVTAYGKYHWYEVCFDSATVSSPNGLPGGCGYVASNWLSLKSDTPITNPNATYAEFKAHHETYLPAPTGILTVLGGLSLPAPDSDDQILGQGGCTECSSTAPGRFEMLEGSLACSGAGDYGSATLSWESASGANEYEVYRDSELISASISGMTFVDPENLELGREYVYFVKARNGNGSRNADTAWMADVPETLCGAPEPPPPYEGPVPIVSTNGYVDRTETSVRLEGIVNPNTLSTSTYFEYGETTAYGFATPLYAQGSGETDLDVSWLVAPLTCETTYHFRLVAEHPYGTVYGNEMEVTTAECAPSTPTNLEISHDVVHDALYLSWEEGVLSHGTVIIPELKIVADPRPGIELETWSVRPSQSPGVSEWKDVWLSPQPGGEYCYRVRTWNTSVGSAGYSNYSNEVCITVEGVLMQLVDFPQNVEARLTPGSGLELIWTSGTGVFSIERRIEGGLYTNIASVDVDTTTTWLDTNVLSSTSYCYRFVQAGQASAEYCNTYYDADATGTPTLYLLERVNSTSINLSFSSVVPDQGYFKIYRQDPQHGWIPSGGSAFFTGSAMIEKEVYGEETLNECYYVEQWLNGVATPESNTLCLSPNVTSSSYMFVETNTAPTAPSTLRVGGQENPLSIGTYTPVFSAVFNDANTGDSGTYVQIQISVDSSDWSSLLWDSGQTALAANILVNAQSEEILYTGAALSHSVSYYWRVKFWDIAGTEGVWSNESASFMIAPPPPEPNTHALLLDGVNDYVSITDANQTNLESMDAITIEAQVKFDTLPISPYTIVSKFRGGSWNWVSYLLYFANDGGYKLVFIPGDGTGGKREFYFTWTPELDTWYRIALTYDTVSGTAKLYIDGTLFDAQTKGPVSIGNTAEPVVIGAHSVNATPQAYLKGAIDDVRIWNIERSASDIDLYKDVQLYGDETGLAGYWTFNEGILDASPNGNNMVIAGNPSYDNTDLPFGQTGNSSNGSGSGSGGSNSTSTHSLKLDGVDDYVWIDDNAQTGLEAMNAITIEAWLNFSNLPASGEIYSILTKAKDGNWNWVSYYLYAYNNAGTYEIVFVPADGSGGKREFYFVWNGLVADTWYHLALTFDCTTNDATLYIDGVSLGTQNKTLSSIGNTAEPVSIGARNVSVTPSHFFNGYIDDVRIWNIARSSGEITADMDRALVGNESGLVSYWQFDGDFDDLSGNTNHLSNQGATTDASVVAELQ